MGYDDWAAQEFWYIEEAAQLCFYPDPIDHDYESYDYVPDGLPMECDLEVKRLYERIRRAVRGRAFRAWHETDDYGSYRFAVKPMDFVSWCKSEGIELPTELVEAVHSYFDRRVQNRIDASRSEVAPATKGPPEKYDWELFYIEIIRIANGADDLPKNQAELIRHMQSWYADRNEDEPGYSTLKLKISRIYKYLREANKPKD